MKKNLLIIIGLLLVITTPFVAAPGNWPWSHPCDYTYEQWADWCVDQHDIGVTYQECLAHWEQECSPPPAQDVPEFTIVTGLLLIAITGLYLFKRR